MWQPLVRKDGKFPSSAKKKRSVASGGGEKGREKGKERCRARDEKRLMIFRKRCWTEEIHFCTRVKVRETGREIRAGDVSLPAGGNPEREKQSRKGAQDNFCVSEVDDWEIRAINYLKRPAPTTEKSEGSLRKWRITLKEAIQRRGRQFVYYTALQETTRSQGKRAGERFDGRDRSPPTFETTLLINIKGAASRGKKREKDEKGPTRNGGGRLSGRAAGERGDSNSAWSCCEQGGK